MSTNIYPSPWQWVPTGPTITANEMTVTVPMETFVLNYDDGKVSHTLKLNLPIGPELEFWRPYLDQFQALLKVTQRIEVDAKP